MADDGRDVNCRTPVVGQTCGKVRVVVWLVSGCGNITIDQPDQSSKGGARRLVGVGVGVCLKMREGWEFWDLPRLELKSGQQGWLGVERSDHASYVN